MPTKWMPLRQERVVEIVGRIMRHADLLHHAAGGEVRGHRERYDLFEPERFETEGEHGPRALRGVSLPPVLRAEAPPDLHARSEVCLEAGHRETDETREGRSAADFHGPEPEAALIEVSLDPRDKGVAFLPRQDSPQVLHDPWIGIQRRERRPIGGEPSPETQPIGLQLA